MDFRASSGCPCQAVETASHLTAVSADLSGDENNNAEKRLRGWGVGGEVFKKVSWVSRAWKEAGTGDKQQAESETTGTVSERIQAHGTYHLRANVYQHVPQRAATPGGRRGGLLMYTTERVAMEGRGN